MSRSKKAPNYSTCIWVYSNAKEIANIDPRSLRLNFELGLELFSFECNAWLAHYFHSLFAESHWLDPRAPETRPYLVRLRDALAWLFSPYL
ncbi:hypothetical protein N9O33_00765 [Gammaproteobacteria bacterium]|nr:hypothetical protein [Gammaproteobacteria bacterium]